MNWIYYALTAAAGLIIGALITAIISLKRERRLVERLQTMLQLALSGEYDESLFDESVLSAIESEMAGFLSSSLTSSKKVKAERDKIKTLIADISHQTKTPISNILLYSQLLGEKNLSPEEKKAVNALEKQGAKLSFLIESLVKLSRLETGIIEVSPQPGTLYEVFSQLEMQIRDKADTKGVKVAFSSGIEQACFDARWTQEALFNILENAVKYTNPGGSVLVDITDYEMFCRIDIKDTGIGIPEQEHSKVFGRFYRADSSREQDGVGIGLFLAREIISAQGGYIKLSSEEGRGSCFSVFLPKQ